MEHAKLALGALAAAMLVSTSAMATTKVFDYDLGGTPVATGTFSYATGATGVLGYGDLTAFSVTLFGDTYTLADALAATDYVHFAYDTSANDFVTDPNSCGFSGCGFMSSLSAINSTGTFGYFFTSAPGGFGDYTAGGLTSTGSFDTIVISDAVPEPANWALMLIGFGALGGMARFRRAAVTAS